MVLPVGAQEYSGIRFMDNQPWSEVMAKATAEHKIIFIDCYTSWCGPCKALAREVFPTKICGDYFNSRFICTKYDMEKGDGKMLYDKYKSQIPGFPTMLLIDTEGKVLHRIVGFKKPEELIKAVDMGLKGKTLDLCRQRYEAGDRSFTTISDYAAALALGYEHQKRNEIIREYMATLPVDSMMNPAILNLCEKYLDNINDPRFRYVYDNFNRVASKTKFDRYKLESRLLSAMRAAVRNVVRKLDESENDAAAAEVKPMLDTLHTYFKTQMIGDMTNLEAKTIILDARIAGDVERVIYLLEASKALHVAKEMLWFRPSMFKYVIDHTKNKKLLQSYYDEVEKFMKEQRGEGLFAINHYDTMARIAYRMGDSKKAEELEIKYEELLRKRYADAVKMLNGNKERLDKAFQKQVGRQRKYLNMPPLNE